MHKGKSSYKTVVIDLRRIIKQGTKTAVLFLSASVILSFLFFSFKTDIFNKDFNLKSPASAFFKIIFGFDPKDEASVMKSALPFMASVENSPLFAYSNEAKEAYNPEGADTKETDPEPKGTEGKRLPIKAIDSSQNKNLANSGQKILIKNETSYGVNVSDMLSSGTPFKFDKKGPQILILHTHATESYSPEGENSYNSAESDRTTDINNNMIKVGEEMAEIFKENGVEVIHDKTLHDYPNYNGSYGASLKTAEGYLKKYPSIKMVLDIHRDAIVYTDGTKAKVLCTINGKNSAQLMLVIGTDAGGLFHPNWRKNMQTAVNIQAAAEKKYPGLMRGINLRKERFNEHLTAGSMIIEVGTSGNTLSEAVVGAKCIAGIIAEELSSK